MGWETDKIVQPSWQSDAVVSAPTAGGVQDYEPMQREPRSFGERAVDWAKTRGIKAATSFAGQERGLADLVKVAAQKLGVPDHVAHAIMFSNPVTTVGQFLPSTDTLNDTVFNKGGVSETNLPGKIGKAVDVGVETALQAPAFPGSIARNVFPAFVGGTAQELAGQTVEGTPMELPVRVLAGGVAGAGAAGVQNVAGNAVKGVTNALAANTRNVDQQAARILGRALERDNTNYNALAQTHGAFPEGTPLVVAGGENVRGAVRGSTAAPGPARTTVADASENYLTGADKRVGGAISQNVSNEPPIMTRINALEEGRAKAAGPAYEAAGIPRERSQLPNADKLLMSDDLLYLIKESPDVQAAFKNARRVPELKNEPNNSMAVLDRAYKHLEGLEQEAKRQGNNTRAADLRDLRQRFAAGIDSEKPQYGDARAAFSEPSKLIDAANTGRDAFAKNLPPDEVKRVFSAMSADQQKEFLGGVADFLRTKAANTDRATAAERIWNNQNVRDRLKAILPDDQYAAFSKLMDQEKQGAKVLRGINQGSRTAPMLMEGADNAETGNALVNLLRGRFGTAALDMGNALTGRILEGRTQKVNDRLARWLMSSDPKAIQAVNDLIERARVKELTRAGARRNALATGAALPATEGAR